MSVTPPYAELLTLIEGRSDALRVAAGAAPDRDARVPGCPDWTLTDLLDHVSGVQRFWAAAVRAADPSGPPRVDDRAPAGDPVTWSAEATRDLLAALADAGPDTPCWAWWGPSGRPLTVGAVARHQVQEAAVHAYDAQETIGSPEPLPAAVAVDGVEEFLAVVLASHGAWPGRPARLLLSAVEGPRWTVDLSPSGVTLDPAAAGDPVVTAHGTASELVLALYERVPWTSLRVDGDRSVFDELHAW
jgi:uncharacterized protein (TIGR03083 family)